MNSSSLPKSDRSGNCLISEGVNLASDLNPNACACIYAFGQMLGLGACLSIILFD